MIVPTGRIAVAAHDAGAANLIFGWIDAGDVPEPAEVFLAGPAAAIWSRRLPRITPNLAGLADASIDMLISGTGWASDYEHCARKAARLRGLHTIAAIDHWVNYEGRFRRGNETELPDELWVSDDVAARIATRAFPDLPLVIMPNRYLEREVAAVQAASSRQTSDDILYVLEPVRDTWGRQLPGEFQALDYLVDRRNAVGFAAGAKLVLRPHPSDPEGKYDGWIAVHRDIARLDGARGLAEAIGDVGTVAGCNSFAMVIALAAGRRVLCTLPPWAPACVLPHDGIVRVKDLG
jgi:hypothetical protein